ncbi:type II toxin-antitoxin system HicB family antitoxin [Nostocaceae cyanobacterium CENA357]|uniref:Type II toxin-antitoxin system HicB family antitoxin n=1 Tax=Atlanticothrix silvestris CENA357 TaxID=1725252 RepID=A0A8J7HDD7_9CYAN|nr:type II toxin-antitoxin system HicB family antitoxin [Atlanticothrix silvestris]MBH8550975.1 type II toxin-antitoxin system HicB family antitoxin [Atlanticothrix silvestris CENA357]
MLTNYIHTAMHKATYELLEDGTFYGEIPECQGVWANAMTLEACREDLQDTLEGWLILGLRLDHTLPILDGIDLNLSQEVA